MEEASPNVLANVFLELRLYTCLGKVDTDAHIDM